MRLHEFLDDLGRHITYYPALARLLGGVKQAILYCQLHYWQDRHGEDEFWLTAAQIEDQTGLSYEEQRAARGHLVKLGLIEERQSRLEHRLYFRLRPARLSDLWEHRPPNSRNGKSPIRELGNPQSDHIEEYMSLKSIETESISRLTLPSSSSDAKREHIDQAREVLGFLNEKCAAVGLGQFRAVKTHLTLIAARLADGASVQDCRSVVARKCREWQDDPKSRTWIRPKTIFRESNFENYLGQLAKQP